MNRRQQHNRSLKTDKSSTNQFDNSLDAEVFVSIPIQPMNKKNKNKKVNLRGGTSQG